MHKSRLDDDGTNAVHAKVQTRNKEIDLKYRPTMAYGEFGESGSIDRDIGQN
jgi:hypothetical protein